MGRRGLLRAPRLRGSTLVLDMSDYFFGYSNFDKGIYDPSHECFHVGTEEVVGGGNAPAEQGDHTPPIEP